MRNIALLSLLLVFLTWSASFNPLLSQGLKMNNSYYENFTPPKPGQASLGTFGNTKLNYYRGLPEVVVDLFTLEGREFRLPISLSYDASGIRTDEFSGTTGIKWNLNAGGYITRDLEGLPDEHPQKGFWKLAAETNYFKDINQAAWAGPCERGERDCAPDYFTINISGRTIRFVFDKNKVPRAIPGQKVKIEYALKESTVADEVKINEFTVTLENGERYVFGGTDNTVNERKIEKFVMKTSFNFKIPDDCPYTSPQPADPPADVEYWCKYGFEQKFDFDTDNSVKSTPYHTVQWWLREIVTTTGERTVFHYDRLPDIVYSSRPSAIKIAPVLTAIPLFEEIAEYCDLSFLGACVIWKTFRKHYHALNAVVKFPKTNPGWYKLDFSGNLPFTEYFSPLAFRANPGNVTFFHQLITEKTVHLREITAANGSKVVFESSGREDLPNARKVDVVKLLADNQVVQSRRLNYEVYDCSDSIDYLWFSEALLVKHLKFVKGSEPYTPSSFLNHIATDVGDPAFAKYVFEGLKPYNFKRRFLSSIDDLTSNSIESRLYTFGYVNPAPLRRRGTMFFDPYGFARDWKRWESHVVFSPSRTAYISNSYHPADGRAVNPKQLAGRLQRIGYPTGGYTDLQFDQKYGRLSRISDHDTEGTVVREREIEYPSCALGTTAAVFHSYQDFYVEKEDGWMKYAVSSSSPQNDSFTGIPFADPGCGAVKAYNGTKANNMGWEEFTFTSNREPEHRDSPAIIYSVPAELNLDGSPLTGIFPFPKNNDKSHLRGLLKSHKVFSRSGAIVSEIINEYEINPYPYFSPTVTGMKCGTFNWTSREKTDFWVGREVEGVQRQRYAFYNIKADWIPLVRQRTISRDDSNSGRVHELVTEYKYDAATLQPVEKIFYVAADPSYKTISKTKYATHSDYDGYRNCYDAYMSCRNYCKYVGSSSYDCYSNCERNRIDCENFKGFPHRAAIAALETSHAVNTPVEISTWVEEAGVRTLMGAVVYKYGIIEPVEAVRPLEVWETNEALTHADYRRSYFDSDGHFILDPRMKKVHTFNSYDTTSSRLLVQTSADGQSERYEWEYEGTYISRKVLNPGPLQQNTSFSYKPHVGLTEIKDPNGVKESFLYDAYGRLEKKLKDGDLQTRYFYHKLVDTPQELLNASIKAFGPLIIGHKVRFETEDERRPYGNTSYAWSITSQKTSDISSPWYEFTFSTPGEYEVKLFKRHPEYGSASATLKIEVFSERRVTVCANGPTKLVAAYQDAVEYGKCTDTSRPSRTSLIASYEGICGPIAELRYRWEVLNNGVWQAFSNAGPVASPPSNFDQRIVGEYPIRCTITDSCGFQSVSAVQVLSVF